MLKNKIKFLLSNKLFLIVFSALTLICMIYLFIEICGDYKERITSAIIIEGNYIYDRPYATTSFSDFYVTFSIILFFIVPISLCFDFSKKSTYNDICLIRGKGTKQAIIQALSISIITAGVYLFLFIICLFAFYFTMGFKMEAWQVDHYLGTNILNNPVYLQIYNSKDYLGHQLMFLNNGKLSILYYLVFGTIGTIIFFIFVFTNSIFACMFNNTFKPLAFMLFSIIYLFILNYFWQIDLSTISMSYNYDNTYMKSIIIFILISLVISLLSIMVISYLKKKFNKID